MYDKELLKLYRFVCKNVVKSTTNPMYRKFVEKYQGKELTATDEIKINDYIVLFSVTNENTVYFTHHYQFDNLTCFRTCLKDIELVLKEKLLAILKKSPEESD